MLVRRAAPGDEGAVRALRIAAMTDSPEAFGSTAERERGRTTEDWTAMVASGEMFLLEDGPIPVGLAGLHEGHLVSMWVAPEARGQGGGDRLVEAVVADADGAELHLWVTDGNDRARRLYERHGFELTGRREVRMRDRFA